MFITLILAASLAADAEPVRREWAVGDDRREALVCAPASAKTQSSPLIFVWHGHGGTAKHAAEKWAYHKIWPEAVVVYPQGLPTPGKLTDPDGKRTGWQHNPGELADRDLKFFDVILASLRKDYSIDAKRIYATGHSNGGRFTYLLWANRGDSFAAVAPSGSPATVLVRASKPKPCLHLAGEKDPLVKFDGQMATMAAVRTLNGCEMVGKPWDKAGPLVGTLYPSKLGAPFVSLLHPGGHEFPAEGPKLIVKFFKEHSAK